MCRRLWWETGYFLTPRHRDSHTCANVFVLTPASARQQKITSSGFLPPPSAHPQTRDIAGLLLFGPVYFLLSAPTVNETRCEQAHRSHLSHRTPSLPPSLAATCRYGRHQSPPVSTSGAGEERERYERSACSAACLGGNVSNFQTSPR